MDKREILSFLINLLVIILTFVIIDIAFRIENYKKKKEEKKKIDLSEYIRQQKMKPNKPP